MAKKNSERDELRVVQRSWGAYQPITQARADFLTVLKLLSRKSGGGRGALWARLQLSKAQDAAGYTKLRLQVHILGPENTLAQVFEALPNLHPRRRRRQQGQLALSNIEVEQEADSMERERRGTS